MASCRRRRPDPPTRAGAAVVAARTCGEERARRPRRRPARNERRLSIVRGLSRSGRPHSHDPSAAHNAHPPFLTSTPCGSDGSPPRWPPCGEFAAGDYLGCGMADVEFVLNGGPIGADDGRRSSRCCGSGSVSARRRTAAARRASAGAAPCSSTAQPRVACVTPGPAFVGGGSPPSRAWPTRCATAGPTPCAPPGAASAGSARPGSSCAWPGCRAEGQSGLTGEPDRSAGVPLDHAACTCWRPSVPVHGLADDPRSGGVDRAIAAPVRRSVATSRPRARRASLEGRTPQAGRARRRPRRRRFRRRRCARRRAGGRARRRRLVGRSARPLAEARRRGRDGARVGARRRPLVVADRAARR